MMNNLFSIFDPSTSSLLSLNWMMLLSSMIMFPMSFWVSSSNFFISWKILFSKFFQEMKNNLNFNKIKYILFLNSFFFLILVSNLIGLLPYVFTCSSHLIFSMFLAFSFWISLILFGVLNKFNMMMYHMVPMGSPIFLSVFMVLIETISNLIRPITLSIRLTANMISGHLLIHLLSSIACFSNNLMVTTIPVMIILMMLETAVAVIQSFVFVTLISLYINEI
uniref:ATP synthase subunit a n=1 Tax=Bothriocroton undatum TaxID=65642 RepID=H9M739_9ACAR|nr:ATP synthase F0 subunit 6 [Bothriocroton undatum]AET63056.1 ATP synthase F0 subunit 6 [Bothriocroton undatum]